MADDAPADAGTDESVQRDPAHPGNGETAGPGASVGRSDLRPADRTSYGGAPVGGRNGGGSGSGAGVDDLTDPVSVTELTTESLTTESLTAGSVAGESAVTDSVATESLGTESLGTESLGTHALGTDTLVGESTSAQARPVRSDQGGEPNGLEPESRPADASVERAADPEAQPATALAASAELSEETPAESESAGSTPVGRTGRPGRTRTRRGRGSFWRELPVLVVIAVGLAILIRTFLVQAFFIPSGSMEKTLHGCPGCSGDRVLVNKLANDFHDPRPGDVTVFKGPPSWDAEVPFSEPSNAFGKAMQWIGQTIGVSQPDEKDFVKRVIAVGGQTVACCDPQGRVTVNGTPLNEPYIFRSNPDSQPQEFGPVTVPKGRLWMMGDHRDGSADSRAHIDDGNSGTVPVSDVIGKAFVIVWPPSRWNTLGTPATFHGVSSLGPLTVGAPMALGVIGTLPLAGFRLRRRRRGRRNGRSAGG